MPTDNLPSDIDPESRCRVPLADRSKLTGEAAEMYDQHVSGESKSLKGLFGPGGIRLHSPRLSAAGRAQARYLRHEAGIDGDLRELAILIAAREADSNFAWCAHEGVGRAEGLPEDVIEAVRLRTSVDGLA